MILVFSDKVLMENITDKLHTFEEERAKEGQEIAMDKFPVSTVHQQQQVGYQPPYEGGKGEKNPPSYDYVSGVSDKNREERF